MTSLMLRDVGIIDVELIERRCWMDDQRLEPPSQQPRMRKDRRTSLLGMRFSTFSDNVVSDGTCGVAGFAPLSKVIDQFQRRG